MATAQNKNTVERAALDALSRREYGGEELSRKLIAKGFEATSVAQVLERLKEKEWLSDERFTALVDTDLDAKVSATCSALAEHDLVYLHIKGTDVCAHDREPVRKMQFIEKVDAALAPLAHVGAVIVVTARVRGRPTVPAADPQDEGRYRYDDTQGSLAHGVPDRLRGLRPAHAWSQKPGHRPMPRQLKWRAAPTERWLRHWT